MRKIRNHCDLNLLNRFMDQEVTVDEKDNIIGHLETCPPCRKIVLDHRILTAAFRAGMEKMIPHAVFETLEDGIIDTVRTKRTPWWTRVRQAYESKKRLIPAMAMAGLLIILFSPVKHTLYETGPSAIIRSFSGNVSKVMFLETPNSHQTIIWFNDVSNTNDDKEIKHKEMSNV